MRWPWAWRRDAQIAELRYQDAVKLIHEQSGRIAELRAALAESEAERKQAHLQLLRAFNGLPIFPEQVAEKPVAKDVAENAEPLQMLDFASMPEDEINALLVKEAIQKGIRNMAMVTSYVDRRKSELWAEQHPAPDSSEAILRAKAIASMEDAVMEGRASSVTALETEGK